MTRSESVATLSAASGLDRASLVKRARKYIFFQMPRINGYLSAVDALAITTILIGQREAALGGGIAEIGVYFGRSFYLMALLIERSERALPVDLFDVGASEGRNSRQLESFIANGKLLNINFDPEMVLVGNSRELKPADIMAKAGRLRFFSVDGGHSLEDVLSDAALAAQTMSDHGVICFDDFCNPEWPEVTFGIYEFLRNNSGSFVPLLATQKKLFVCKREYRDFYVRLICGADELRKIPKASRNLLGDETLLVRSTQLEYLRCEAFARIGLGPLNALAY